MEPFEDYVDRFNEAYKKLLLITPEVDNVNDLKGENEQFQFIQSFRELMRLRNVLNTFTEFQMDTTDMGEQEFEDYKSKYLDLHDRVKSDRKKEKVSILNDIDFELELIHRDEINVSYILKLLSQLKDKKPEDQEREKNKIIEIMLGETQLRSKRELIEKFINEHLPYIEDPDTIPQEFETFWTEERKNKLQSISEEEGLDREKLEKVIGDYLFTEKEPLRDELISMLNKRPSLKERSSKAERLTTMVKDFVETFISGLGI
jgi:type I restriction enzyme R subunit